MIAPRKNPTFWNRFKKGMQYAFRYGGGYDATQNSRYRDRKNIGSVRSEETELANGSRNSLISILLDQRRNNPVVRSICRLREEDVVGRGLMPRPQTGDADVDKQIQKLWYKWSYDCEVSGLDMCSVQRLLASSTLCQGDAGIMLLDDGRVQLIGGEQIGSDMPSILSGYKKKIQEQSQENIVDGVELNDQGLPIAYHVGSLQDGHLRDKMRVDAKDFILHAKINRIGQVRGIPELATAVDTLMDINEYDRIEMIAAKVSASLAAVVKKQDSLDFEIGSRGAEDQRMEYFEPGKFHYMEPGEDVSVIGSGGRPNVNAIDWMVYKLRQVGSTIGIPVEYLLMTIGETSFSASQGMILLYQSTIEAEQRYLKYTLGKIYRWKISQWLLSGELDLPDNLDPYMTNWQAPAFRWVNRSSAVEADIKYLQMGAMSLQDICSQFGSSPQEVFGEKAKEIVLAKQIAERDGLDSWRDLFNPMITFGSFAYEPTKEPEIEDPETKDIDEEEVDNG